MSTRSATIVMQQTDRGNEVTNDELFRFYRHCDGYPDGHGLDMAKAFIKAEEKGTADSDRWISVGLNNRNWVQTCFAELFNDDCDLEVEPLGTLEIRPRVLRQGNGGLGFRTGSQQSQAECAKREGQFFHIRISIF